MILDDSIGALFNGHLCSFSPGVCQRVYHAALAAFAEIELQPDRLAADAPGVGKGYGNFRLRRPRLEQANFDTVKYFTIARLAAGGAWPDYEWEFVWTFNRLKQEVAAGYVLGSLPSDFDVAERHFRLAIRDSQSQYGYLFRQHMQLGPIAYAGGTLLAGRANSRPRELRSNICWWGYSGPQGSPQDFPILRDIYPHSYLSERYLVAPIGRSSLTLREWIRADPTNRGTLEPYTKILTKWTPPIEKIPQIREDLYRAGRVFYWRFFCPSHAPMHEPPYPEPLYRPDPREPWEAPDPIPEIFRADYWKDKDPGLTY